MMLMNYADCHHHHHHHLHHRHHNDRAYDYLIIMRTIVIRIGITMPIRHIMRMISYIICI